MKALSLGDRLTEITEALISCEIDLIEKRIGIDSVHVGIRKTENDPSIREVYITARGKVKFTGVQWFLLHAEDSEPFQETCVIMQARISEECMPGDPNFEEYRKSIVRDRLLDEGLYSVRDKAYEYLKENYPYATVILEEKES